MDTALYLLSRILVVLATLGVIGCLLVIPFTAASILRVVFQKDSATEPDAPQPAAKAR